MASKLGGLGTVVLAGATATCGLLLLGGVGPAPAGAEVAMAPVETVDDTVTDDTVEDDPDGTTNSMPDETAPTTEPTTSEPSTSEPSTSEPSIDETTTTTTTAAPVPLSPVPLSVSASNGVVGAGGVVTFSGTCDADADGPRGPLVVWVIGTETDVIDTGVASADWSYGWTAPTDEADFGSFTFQFWCGDPAGADVGYPADLERRVDMVASAAPTPPSAPPLVESDPDPITVIPETD